MGTRKRPFSMQFVPAVSPPRSFPLCIVWSPIPGVSAVLPFIGHMGVCLTNGLILDFAGSYYVSVDAMAFGYPTRYWQLDPARAGKLLDPLQPEEMHKPNQAWDDVLQDMKHEYQQRPYSMLSCNCHHFVVQFMNSIGYDGRTNWTLVELCISMLRFGRHTNLVGILKTWLPFVLVMLLGCWWLGLRFLLYWSLCLACVTGLFLWADRRRGSESSSSGNSTARTSLPTSHNASIV